MSKFKKNKSSIADTYSLSSSTGYAFLLILSAILFFISFAFPSTFSGVRTQTVDFFSPVISFVSSPFQAISDNISSVSGVASLRAENATLKSENERLKEWYQTALMLQAENQSLQKLLNVKTDANQKFITARILSDNKSSFVKTVLLASGKVDGIKKQQAVLSGEGMIGRIIDAGENSSRILLLTDVNSRLPIMIEGTNQKAILKGTNDENPVLTHLPNNIGNLNGARIVTSGDGGVFPAGLPVGRVVSNDDQNVVKLYGEIDKISFVRVIDTTVINNLMRENFGRMN